MIETKLIKWTRLMKDGDKEKKMKKGMLLNDSRNEW